MYTCLVYYSILLGDVSYSSVGTFGVGSFTRWWPVPRVSGEMTPIVTLHCACQPLATSRSIDLVGHRTRHAPSVSFHFSFSLSRGVSVALSLRLQCLSRGSTSFTMAPISHAPLPNYAQLPPPPLLPRCSLKNCFARSLCKVIHIGPRKSLAHANLLITLDLITQSHASRFGMSSQRVDCFARGPRMAEPRLCVTSLSCPVSP